ncbi:ABC transporter substrate-binding protein [Helcococcus ovis]|uniref:ABC transporter substrate-binding protein n=1 Tax=Helcococcus ovis TaxID=72026 RepID=UPI0038BB2B02
MKKSLLFLLSFVFLLVSCSPNIKHKEQVQKKDKSVSESYVIKDIKGRQVKFEKVPKKVITLGHGTLKYYTYVAGPDELVGIEKADKSVRAVEGQSIHHAYENIRNVETVGNGGPKISPNYEKLAYTKADVIFAAYESSKEDFDKLQEKSKIPVVAISTIMSGNIFTDDAYKTFEIIGKTMKKEKRAEEIISKIKEVEKDLKSRSKDINKELSPETYFGATSFRGPQGILSTKTNLDLLNVIKVKNVMEKYTKKRSIIIDKEKLLEINPDQIILDMSGKKPLYEDIKRDPNFYNSLKAFKNNKVYAIMPYFTYGMNFDTALVNMYYIGKLMYPENYKDVNLKEKANSIYKTFVGKEVYESMIKVHPESFKEFKINE